MIAGPLRHANLLESPVRSASPLFLYHEGGPRAKPAPTVSDTRQLVPFARGSAESAVPDLCCFS